MLTIDQAKKRIEANSKRISELDVEIKRVSDPVKNSSSLYNKKVRAEKEVREKLALASAEGKPANELLELQKAVDAAFNEVRQHEANINAFRTLWRKFDEERKLLRAEVEQLEKLVNHYQVYAFIDKTYFPVAKKFAESVRELDSISREHELNDIFENLGTVVNFPINENGIMNTVTLFHGSTHEK